MSTFDTLAIIVLAISLVYSLFRGLVREIFALLAYIGGYFLAINYRESFSSTIYQQVPNKTASEIISFALIFIGSVIAISIVGKIVQNLVHSAPGLSGLDRIFGGLIGIAKGVIILIILMFPLKMFPDLHKNITRDSFLAPHIINFSNVLGKGMRNEKIFDKLPSIDLKGVKEGVQDKLKTLKNLEASAKKLTTKSIDAANEMENPGESMGEPQDDYTNEDRSKLNDIILSVDKK